MAMIFFTVLIVIMSSLLWWMVQHSFDTLRFMLNALQVSICNMVSVCLFIYVVVIVLGV